MGFCHIIAMDGTRKLLRARRRPQKVTDVLQDGRLYVLDIGQQVHFESVPHAKETCASTMGLGSTSSQIHT